MDKWNIGSTFTSVLRHGWFGIFISLVRATAPNRGYICVYIEIYERDTLFKYTIYYILTQEPTLATKKCSVAGQSASPESDIDDYALYKG